ncbi:translocase [Paenibacillus darwinianus]|uniref:Sec-independent protein translocase protein TatA n=1 Tax=Paenibacillus darwinianus TaxID=1380763 RepID=A0A9W5S1Y4_9BACL|nr:twin-arginine translocase TatA/TatE family subunit [Paenibacillus darwinianus]EXX88805.1 translocase [Paenibacillus darwinianus]EXX89154.1 translocase [Paenibacillus darwinianus]EXX90491.1 translocase [Paenibacillus darwinianus]
MPNIGVTGFILLVLIALLLFGPSKLPELGRAFGRTLREFKNGARDMMEDDEKNDKKRVDVSRAENDDDERNSKRLPD